MDINNIYNWIVDNSISIRNWVTFAADICILLITLYTFYFTFLSQKIAILSYGKSSGNSGDSYNVILENKTLSPIAVKKVSMIIDDRWKFIIKDYNVPLIIQPFSVELIEQEKYGYMENEKYFKNKKIVFEVETSKYKLYRKFNKKIIIVSKQMKKILYNCSTITSHYGDIMLFPNTKYVIDVFFNEKFIKTVQIFDSGIMVGDINGINAVESEYIDNINMVRDILNEVIKDTKYSIKLSEPQNLYPT